MLLSKADKLPPFLVRLLARRPKTYLPLTDREIAARSGISRWAVATISRQSTWAKIPIGTADRFAEACGVNLSEPATHLFTLRKLKMVHLQRATPQQRKFFAALMQTAVHHD